MYVAIMAFNAKVSDPLIGGTYMTLLNTVSNLGGNWPSTVARWLVDPLTIKECIGAPEQACGNALEAEVSLEALFNYFLVKLLLLVFFVHLGKPVQCIFYT